MLEIWLELLTFFFNIDKDLERSMVDFANQCELDAALQDLLKHHALCQTASRAIDLAD